MSESQIGGIIEIPVCREAGLVRTKLGFCLTNSLTWIFVSSIWEVSEIVVNSALRQIQISSLITSKTSRDVTFYFSLGSFFSPQKKSIDWQRRRKFFFIIISHLDENHKLINRFVRLVLCGNFSHVLSLHPLSPSFLIKYFAPGEYWVHTAYRKRDNPLQCWVLLRSASNYNLPPGLEQGKMKNYLRV